jgi:hypothetical protein
MADTKSMQTLLAEVRTHAKTRNRALDVSDNSFAKDLIFTPYAIGGRLLMNQVDLIKKLNRLSQVTGTDLDDEATNYGLERLTGNYATVLLTYWATNRPTATVAVAASCQARTAGTAFDSPVTFSVISDTNFPIANMDAYYAHDRGRYEFAVRARCTAKGSAGAVGANLITVLVTAVNEINGVTNLTAATGVGLDLEVDDDFRERIRMAILGRGLGTVYGLRGYLMGLGFVDANVVRVEEEGYERASGVDAFAIDFSAETITDTVTYRVAQARYYFSKRPVLEVTTVISASIGVVPANQYNVNIDSTTPLRRSVDADDYLEFSGAPIPDGTSVSITYNYCSAIYQAQQTLNLPVNRILTADALLKRAYPLYLYVNATLTLKANADGPATRNKCRNALSQFLARYRQGTSMQESDLIIVLQNGYGDYPVDTVDQVVITSFYLKDELGTTYLPIAETIALNNKQHAVYGSSAII